MSRGIKHRQRGAARCYCLRSLFHHNRPVRYGLRDRSDVIASIARGRRWLNELIDDAKTNVESIARRERCSVRQVNMTISLAFLAPVLVKAAIEGLFCLSLTRHLFAPVDRSRQQAMLGLIWLMRPGLYHFLMPRQERVRERERAIGAKRRAKTNCSVPETKRSHATHQLAGYLTNLRNTRFEWECVVDLGGTRTACRARSHIEARSLTSQTARLIEIKRSPPSAP